MFSMCSELTPRARIPDTRIPQLMQPWLRAQQKSLHKLMQCTTCSDLIAEKFGAGDPDDQFLYTSLCATCSDLIAEEFEAGDPGKESPPSLSLWQPDCQSCPNQGADPKN